MFLHSSLDARTRDAFLAGPDAATGANGIHSSRLRFAWSAARSCCTASAEPGGGTVADSQTVTGWCGSISTAMAAGLRGVEDSVVEVLVGACESLGVTLLTKAALNCFGVLDESGILVVLQADKHC